MKQSIEELLSGNPYPGRGILIGCSFDGSSIIICYFIMGRSINSRNRVFIKTDDGIRTAAYDPSQMTNPELIIYHPVRTFKDITIVTNGDQTDTIYDHLQKGSDFRSALAEREFEPDAPNYTPRISGIACDNGYELAILKTMNSDPSHCQRCYFSYPGFIPGLGHFISTYKTDGDPLPSFTGEPVPVDMPDVDPDKFAGMIWNALNEENKVSLYIRSINLANSDINESIINKL